MTKTIILAEMLGLLAIGRINDLGAEPSDQPWLVGLLARQGFKRVIAVVVLLVLLLLADDLGFGAQAAVFGGVLLGSYLAARGTHLGAAIIALERRAFA